MITGRQDWRSKGQRVSRPSAAEGYSKAVRQIIIGVRMPGLSKRVMGHRTLRRMTLSGIVKVSRQREDGSLNETYLTATVDLSARTSEGCKIFESFHIIAVPDGEFDTYLALRERVKESMRSQLRRFARTLNGDALFS